MTKEGLLKVYDREFDVFVTEMFNRFGYEVEKSETTKGKGRGFLMAVKKKNKAIPSDPIVGPDLITKKGNTLGIKLFNRSMRMIDAEALEYADKATEHGYDWFFLVSVNGYMNGEKDDIDKNRIMPKKKKISVWNITDIREQASLVGLDVNNDNYNIRGASSRHCISETSNDPPKFELDSKW